MSTTTRPIATAPDAASVLFGQTRRRVLGWLYGHPDEAFYLRQIVRQTGAALGALHRELALLEHAGLITRQVEGRQVYFQANQRCPVFPEIRGLLTKTVGVADVLRDALATIADQLTVAFVFGSVARGSFGADSDIDLLVVGTAPFSAVASATEAAQARLGRDVNPTVYTEHEFRAKVAAGHHFLSSILSEPHVFVIGGPDELRRLAPLLWSSAPSTPSARSAT